MSDWPDPAVDFVQAIADTKLLVGQRYAQWSLAGPTLEDDIGGASAAQEEVGHVRQLFRLLEEQGRDADWLNGARDPQAFANAACLDAVGDSWLEFIAAVAPADRAAWYLLDAIDHDDFAGLVDKMGEDEYFHLEYHDARLEHLADGEADALEAALEATLPGALALIGPADYDAEADPLYTSGFTARPVAELREAFEAHYRSLFRDTPVFLDGVDWDAPTADDWDETRRRAGGGGLSEADVELIQGARNREFAIE
ncbi:MAG: Phenylacetic acid catabolic protein [Halobacteriales archaeon]